MKSRKLIFVVFILCGIVITTSCKKDKEEITEGESILPTSFKVDIPSSISNDQSNKSIQADTLKGNEIYEHLRTFIAIGEGAADIVQSIMQAISVYNINRAMSLSFQGDDDGRTKNLTVVENSSYDGINWEFQMTITDADSESNADGGNGMQIFWNTSPVKGIALLKPYNINRNDTELDQAVFRIDYSEAGEYGYDKHMFVSIIDIPMPDPSIDPFGMNNLKMFAGKTGDIVDIYGNSNHPNAFFYTTNTGFNWAFVASGNEAQDIAVAELGLPPHTLDASDRATLLETYSIKTVLTDEINQHFINTYGFLPDSASLADYLGDADAPGYFNTNGFSQSGSAPSGDYSPLNDNIQSMAPFNPSTVNNLTIEFKN